MFGINEMRRALADKDAQIKNLSDWSADLALELAETKMELARAKDKLNNPPAFKENERIGTIRILKINKVAAFNTHLISAATVGFIYAAHFVICSVLKAKRPWPELPMQEGWAYRFIDEETGQERELHEHAFKKMIREKTAL